MSTNSTRKLPHHYALLRHSVYLNSALPSYRRFGELILGSRGSVRRHAVPSWQFVFNCLLCLPYWTSELPAAPRNTHMPTAELLQEEWLVATRNSAPLAKPFLWSAMPYRARGAGSTRTRRTNCGAHSANPTAKLRQLLARPILDAVSAPFRRQNMDEGRQTRCRATCDLGTSIVRDGASWARLGDVQMAAQVTARFSRDPLWRFHFLVPGLGRVTVAGTSSRANFLAPNMACILAKLELVPQLLLAVRSQSPCYRQADCGRTNRCPT
ncbi:hypothetical protein OBBRIDRAFT_662343 [Obba rivulosa]|uniref:Uncharacterized protein n=1 Tax=Obba rivulosa TaxID=1052685 RepID=A0A8E2DJY9_9APHY|nr:hypothetical protein OBBRIDRAFT_662343 [Obba rivulosa]